MLKQGQLFPRSKLSHEQMRQLIRERLVGLEERQRIRRLWRAAKNQKPARKKPAEQMRIGES